MANRVILLCLLALLTVNFIECRGGGRSSGGRSGGSRGWGGSRGSSRSSGWGWGSSSGSSSSRWGSSSSSNSKPSWGSSSSSGSSHSYPSPSSGLSGSGSSHGYPSSSSGLSGSGSSHNYPSSSSGLSGSGKQNNHGYPASTGMSGSGSSSGHGYPSSNGMSGSGKNLYPSSGTGLSGSSSGYGYPASTGMSGGGKNLYPSSGSGLSGSSSGHKYQPSSGTSGSGSYPGYSSSNHGSGNQMHTYPSGSYGNNNYRPPTSNVHHTSNTYNTHNTHHYSHNYHGSGSGTYIPSSYYTAPQYVYISEYRNSGSRYGDLLTGLALYNMGRSHSHHHNQYYYDDYYNRRYNTAGSYRSTSSSYGTPKESATCTLKIKDNNSIETLKIPCEIVSTFTEDSNKVTTQNTVNTTVCVTETTVRNVKSNNDSNTTPSNVSNITLSQTNTSSTVMSNQTQIDGLTISTEKLTLENNKLLTVNVNNSAENNMTDVLSAINGTVVVQPKNNTINMNATSAVAEAAEDLSDPLLVQPIRLINESSTTAAPITMKPSAPNVTLVNVTKCTTTVNTTDPLTVRGPAVNSSGKECLVQIQTKDSLLQHKVNCDTLIQYAKMPEPKKDESSMMPSRSKLKTWLKNPPWWMSIFIAV